MAPGKSNSGSFLASEGVLIQSPGKWKNAQYIGGVAQLVRVPAGHHGDVPIALLWLRG